MLYLYRRVTPWGDVTCNLIDDAVRVTARSRRQFLRITVFISYDHKLKAHTNELLVFLLRKFVSCSCFVVFGSARVRVRVCWVRLMSPITFVGDK